MAKLLVVSGDAMIGRSLAHVAPIFGFPEAKVCDHREAMREFLSWEPTHVVVLDYSEKVTRRDLQPGFETWRDLKASSTDERLVRCGWEQYPHPDYVQLPLKVVELFHKLHGE